jgi:oxygen-independent coproporphyrinogen-3 oxidase
MTGCYVHLPFCDRICPYCDFAVVQFDKQRLQRYLAALCSEIERAPQPRQVVSSIYLGGGTPSTLSADQLTDLLDLIYRKFGLAPGSVECTLEANPSRPDIGQLRAYRQAGVTRLSVGVQSFHDDELHRLGRDHSAHAAQTYVRHARKAGHANINLDLIAGIPGQTSASFERSLEVALACAPEHMSVYALTIEPDTPYAAWHRQSPQAFPDDDAVAQLLETAHAHLTGAGFEHYEISNYARPGFESAHNWGYWQQHDCLAFGMSAAGFEDGTRYLNIRGFEEYCSAVESGVPPRAEVERLDRAGRIGEAAMLSLRTARGIVDEEFRSRFAIEPTLAFRRARQKYLAAGLLEVDNKGSRLTDRGRLLANTVCAEFLDPDMETAVIS